jgi:hypothetical protein
MTASPISDPREPSLEGPVDRQPGPLPAIPHRSLAHTQENGSFGLSEAAVPDQAEHFADMLGQGLRRIVELSPGFDITRPLPVLDRITGLGPAR